MILRTPVVLAAIILASSAAHAGAVDDLVAAVEKCAAIADNAARYACYDQLPALAKKVSPVAPQTVAARPAAQPAAAPSKKDEESWFGIGDWFGEGQNPEGPTTPQQFGSEGLPPPPAAPGVPQPPRPLDQITAAVTSVTYNTLGYFTVILDNGQVWRQTELDQKARFSKGRETQVTIMRGMLGSYSLKIGDLPHTYRVKRLK